MGRTFEAIYHSGVLVNGLEYSYTGAISYHQPPSPHFPVILGGAHKQLRLERSVYCPQLHTLHVGYTLRSFLEIFHFVRNRQSKYNHESYDVINHNCNCFSDEMLRFLIGRGLPDEIMKMPQEILETSVPRLLRPVLNRWLGGFGSQTISLPSPDGDEAKETTMAEAAIMETTQKGSLNALLRPLVAPRPRREGVMSRLLPGKRVKPPCSSADFVPLDNPNG